jgi:hypothetical protein
MALDVGGLVYVRVVLAHVAPVDPAQGYDLAGAEDLALSGHARTTTRNLAAPSVRPPSDAGCGVVIRRLRARATVAEGTTLITVPPGAGRRTG